MKTVEPKFAILLTIVVFMLQACYCTSIPNVVCMKDDGTTYIWGLDDLWGRDECAEAGDTYAGTTEQEPTAIPPVLPQNNGTNNIIAPSGLNCNNLQLTAPLSGLPNGSATFYWNALPGAVSYRINIYDHTGSYLATFDSQPGATNLSADVSWGAIGGQYELRVELVAFGGGTSCRETVTIPREAPAGGVPSGGGGNGNGGGGGAPAPTPIPSCIEEPWQSWCLR